MEYKQGYKARMNESLGERRGKESGKKQSYKARRHESMGMHDYDHHKDHKMGHDLGHGHNHIAHSYSKRHG